MAILVTGEDMGGGDGLANHQMWELERIRSDGVDRWGPLKDSMVLFRLLDVSNWGDRRSGGESGLWRWWKGNLAAMVAVVEEGRIWRIWGSVFLGR